MLIRTDKSVFHTAGFGTVWAGVYIEHDGFAFPENNWDDIAFGVLGLWGDASVGIIEDEGSSHEFWFMDGSFFFSCVRRGDNLSVECVRDGKLPIVERRFSASAEEFLTSYVAAFDELYDVYAKLDKSNISLSTEKDSLDLCITSRARILEYLQA